MALTQIADIVEPSVFEPYLRLRTAELSAFWEAGAVQPDERLGAFMAGGGTVFSMPSWGDLTGSSGSESVVGDDSTTPITALKLGTQTDLAAKHFRNQAWSAADIVLPIAGDDPQAVVADQLAAYWAREYQDMLIASLQGVFADNVANDSGDMVYDIATDGVAAVTAAEKISAEAVLQALQTLGDASGAISAFGMHSVPATELKRQNLIDFIPNSRGEVAFARYLDKLVVVDDGLPAVAGSNRIVYSTYFFGSGALSFGRGEPKGPAIEFDREPLQGLGSGVETMVSRQHIALHPRGVAFIAGSMAGLSPTNAELAAAANWNRVYPERKQIRLAELQTNG